MGRMPEFETRCLSSLVKVFPDEELKDKTFNHASALLNETYSFQVAYRKNGDSPKKIKVRMEGALQNVATIRSVGLVPSEFPCYLDHDDYVLRTTPGLYPDPLYPLDHNEVPVPKNQWRSVWVTVNLNEKIQAGLQQIKLVFETAAGEQIGEETFELEIIPASLPEQRLICTQWFHADCLATHYDVDVFSEEHWNLIEQYVQTATVHGMNMLLTPLFTPPLDTDVGQERPTVQLVEVEKTGAKYQFNFDKLTRWIDLCLNNGIKYVEFSHLFTQWGAEHAPKIMANENGKLKKIFGWETDASGREYKDFLSQLFPELIAYIKHHKLEEQVYFHVSDEPNINNLESYKKASELIHDYLSDFPVIDALSDYQFYGQGLVKNPIPANDHMEPFLENKVPNLWTYYCCAQYKKVSNRFFNFPSARNRISGIQLYKYNIAGFLHWGYNFWYSRLSRKKINPFQNTDADGGFPSGDSFLVYPGEDGPIESIRMEVFYDALQDLRALQLLEKLTGRDRVLEIIEEQIPITFTDYPHGSEWLLTMREKINQKISEVN
ncbi:DUF4091 domain-containing protein [Virgibacillus necropolis]|uniref:Glycoside hydrolase 123 catalytic domain-containing protein n=1 Tax=Virgibacillus necropolis TaxID=163877 RepID=A0A221M997_9BACI|nr:DUF4091 domain-containing protein [Virgibacillus necropolis]ASN04205.1 hypothetical protein CFK40_03870 [Virgibacillus necropolis]